MIDKIQQHIEEAKAFNDKNKEALEQFRIKYLGSKGLLKELFAEFKNVPNEQKKDFGKAINNLKSTAQEKVNTLKCYFDYLILDELVQRQVQKG